MKRNPSRQFPDRENRDEGHAKMFEDVQNRQRNIVWPDTMRNGRLVDALLWRGSSEATMVQRIGIAVFGLLFLGFGLFFVFSLAPEFHSMSIAVVGVFSVALGVRVTLNAFRHDRRVSVEGKKERKL